MSAETFIAAVSHLNGPAGAVLTILLAVPVLIGIAKSFLRVRTEFVRHRFESIERAMTGVHAGTAEHELLTESRLEEAIYLGTGLRLSRAERQIVLGWLKRSDVTVSLVRSAWPQISSSGKVTEPSLSRWDRIVMWWMIGSALAFLLMSFLFLLVSVNQVLTGKPQLLLIPMVGACLAVFMIFQARPLISTGILIKRIASDPPAQP